MFSFGLESLVSPFIVIPLLAVPVIIHLINLMRHRRVQWAAMEFLLESQKRNSRWIILKQMLLLMLRLAAIAAIIFMLAQPELQNELGKLLGSQRLHHVVLIDDSLSMTEQGTGRDAFGKASDAVQRLGEDAADQTFPQSLTVLPFSRAAAGEPPLLREVQVNSENFATALSDAVRNLQPTQLRVGPGAALATIEELLGEPQGEQRVYYVVSDFRRNDWDQPGELAASLDRLADEDDAVIRFIDCADSATGNLAVTQLVPAGGTQAAGVPLEMQVAVRNFGGSPARDVTVKLSINEREDRLTIDEIAPGETETRKYEVRLTDAGQHVLGAQLERPDGIAADNGRWCVIDLAAALPVLIVDADPDARDARFLAHALSPGGPVKTGINPQIVQPDFLIDEEISNFSSVYLVNVDHLEPEAVKRLEEYVSGGGGLGIFLGKLTTTRFLSEKLYRDGEGLLPVPITGATDLLLDQLEKSPDIQVEDHPVFAIFAGERNSYLQTVRVNRYYEVDPSWSPPEESTVQVIARLRNNSPLAVDLPFGKGRVVAMFTTTAPDWNNWGRNPSYVVAMQQMQSYLTKNYAPSDMRLVGTPIEFELDAAEYRDKLRFIKPGEDELATVPIDLPQEEDVRPVALGETGNSGVYTVRLTTSDNRSEVRRYAFNVDTEEGNLNKLSGVQLKQRLPGLDFDYTQASQFRFAAELEGTNLSEVFLYLLIVLLIGEQILAYLLSYHPTAQVKGGAQ